MRSIDPPHALSPATVNRVAWRAFAIAVALVTTSGSAAAYTSGDSGYSGEDSDDDDREDCTECHTPGPQQPSAKLLGPPSILAGSQAVYQLVVDTDVTTTASKPHWVGFDIGSSNGVLGTVKQRNPTRLLDGDISHTLAVPRAKILGVSFLLTAPPTPGSLTIYAAALSTDWTFTAANDTTALATLAVNVVAGADLGGVDVDLYGVSGSIDAMSGATAYPATADLATLPVDEARWGCSTGGGNLDARAGELAFAVTAALAFLALWRARRAHTSYRSATLNRAQARGE